MYEYTFSRFAYLDTNILSYLAENRNLWPKLLEFFRQNDLTMGVGGPQVAELSDADRMHKDLVSLFVSVPTGILKNWDMIIDEEVRSHPQRRVETLLFFALNAILLEPNGLDKLLYFLSSKDLKEARSDQLFYASKMQNRMEELKGNFPPSKSGKYTKTQADEFAIYMVMQWLAIDHKDFLVSLRCQSNIEDFHLDVFLSIRLYAYVIFYKYYLGQREPRKLSDFADLGHFFMIPYCEMAIMERDLCNVLNQIKNNHDILESTEIHNIDYIYDIE
jgi:hypothetical protein